MRDRTASGGCSCDQSKGRTGLTLRKSGSWSVIQQSPNWRCPPRHWPGERGANGCIRAWSEQTVKSCNYPPSSCSPVPWGTLLRCWLLLELAWGINCTRESSKCLVHKWRTWLSGLYAQVSVSLVTMSQPARDQLWALMRWSFWTCSSTPEWANSLMAIPHQEGWSASWCRGLPFKFLYLCGEEAGAQQAKGSQWRCLRLTVSMYDGGEFT